MKRIALLLAALVISQPALAQETGSVTVVMSSVPQQQMQYLDSATLAQRIRIMLDNGSLSGIRAPLVLDGEIHKHRIRVGGDPAIYVDSGFNLTTVQSTERDITISYGPARDGGLGVHAEIVDTILTPRTNGTVVKSEGRRSEITGTVPSDGLPQAIMTKPEVKPNTFILPNSLIVLVEP